MTPTTTSDPRSPQPSWQGLFREPVYDDGQPYDGGDEDDDQDG